jgi:hypothetical protein
MIAMYVQNISPHKTLRKMMPKEAFTGVKLEVGHFNIFGCPIYIHDQARPFRQKGYICGVQ